MAGKKDIKDMKEIMEIYSKAGTPGEPHKLLAKLEGSWTTRSRSWTEPDKPPMESFGTCEQKMIMDGRYLQQVYGGDMMGTPFTGISIMGYNNHTKQFESTWVDTMSTGIYKFEGTADRGGKTITQESRYDDPVRGPAIWRTVTRIKDDSTIEFEMFLKPKGKKEEKMMEMKIERKAEVVRKAA